MIKSIIFDLDGTLFDSSEANVAAYSKAFADLHLSFDVDLYRHNFGFRFDEMMQKLAPNASSKTLQTIKQSKATYYKDNLSRIRQNEGLISFIKGAKGHYQIALVTTASHVNVFNLLNHFKLNPDLFDTIITGEDVRHGKPNPECYLLAMKQLKAKPEECLVFEDSDSGVTAAKQAGAHVVRVKL